MGATPVLSTSSRGHRLALGATAVVVVGLVSAYASAIGAQSQSDPIVAEVVSVDGDGTEQTAAGALTMAETGGVVAYEIMTPAPDPAGDGSASDADLVADVDPAHVVDRRVWVRDRVGGTSRAVAEADTSSPGLSGDGCVLAYSVLGADEVRLTVVDRCNSPIEFPLPIGTLVDTVTAVPNALETESVSTGSTDIGAADAEPVAPSPLRTSAPVLSFDGATIVWSTGNEVRRYVRPPAGGPHALVDTFDVVDGGSPDVVTGPTVDVSTDGLAVVFEAGPGAAPYEPSPSNVYVWTSSTTPSGSEPAPDSDTDPVSDPELLSVTVAGDGGAADSASPAISGDGAYVVFESASVDLGVVGGSDLIAPFVVGVDLTARTSQVLVDRAARPALSADGHHVVYQRGAALRVLSADPSTSVDVDIDELAAVDPATKASISQFGRWIVFVSAAGLSTAANAAEPSTAATPTPLVWAIDRRSSDDAVVDTTTTTTPSRGTTTTTTTTTASTTGTTTAGGTSTTATSTSAPESTVPGSARPEVADSPTVPTTTLSPTVTVPGRPSASGRLPRVDLPRFVPRRPTPPASHGRSAQTADPRSTTSSGDVVDIVASPSVLVFEQAVIDVGRRRQTVTVSNTGTEAVQVVGATIDLPEQFTIAADSCSGMAVAPGATCAVEVQFAPTSVGRATGAISVRTTDGSVVTTTLEGDGVPEPTLDLVPAVAGAGQTVTVFGAGFPPGSTIELSRRGAAAPEPIAVDAAGTFAHVVVVLPNTPGGPSTLAVAGQPDSFGDVGVELLVSTRGATAGDAALRGGVGGPIGR